MLRARSSRKSSTRIRYRTLCQMRRTTLMWQAFKVHCALPGKIDHSSLSVITHKLYDKVYYTGTITMRKPLIIKTTVPCAFGGENQFGKEGGIA